MNEQPIYERIRNKRRERGLTLSTLAEKVGSDHQKISRLERGKSQLTIDWLMKLADALDTPVEELIHKEAEVLQQERVPATPPPAAQPDSSLLTAILINIDTALQKHEVLLPPDAKASLASAIFTQATKAAVADTPTAAQDAVLDCGNILLDFFLKELNKR